MKDLHGNPVCVAQMGCRVDASHPADAKQSVQTILATKNRTDARTRDHQLVALLRADHRAEVPVVTVGSILRSPSADESTGFAT